jgi:hypothetical protein
LQFLEPGKAPAFRLIQEPFKSRVYRLGACEPIKVLAGGQKQSYTLDISFSRGVVAIGTTRSFVIPSSARPAQLSVPVECGEAGDITATVKARDVGDDRLGSSRLSYSVFDTARVEPSFSKGRLIYSIDALKKIPDFGMTPSSIVSRDGLTYRETGSNGAAGLPGKPQPDWFGYRVQGLKPGHGYFLEIDYPDNATRLFVIALRDVAEDGYPPSIAVQTGGSWALSGKARTVTIPFWSTSGDCRLLVFTYFAGTKAAVSAMRIREMVEDVRPVELHPQARQVAYWYEEGARFRDLVGENSTPDNAFTAADRYLRLLRASGVSTLVQSMSVYDYQLYPSRYNNDLGSDDQRSVGPALMLGAERYGLRVIAELHSRSDHLLWSATPGDLEQRLLLSRDGSNNLSSPKGLSRPPFFNLLDPSVRRWYLGSIDEAVREFRRFPAFAGIQLRMTRWQNSTLNNFGSLDWGYNASITEQFFRETGLRPSAAIDQKSNSPDAVRTRANDILTRYKQQWIDWRCRKIAELAREVVDLVQRNRSNVGVSLNLFDLNNSVAGGPGADQTQKLKEAGFDYSMLSSIDGLHIVDERWSHGPKTGQSLMSSPYLGPNPETWSPKPLAGRNPWVIWPMTYYEIRSDVWPGEQIGMPEKKKSPWISAQAEPPGRGRLARFAALLANSDPALIGDGGNNFALVDDGLTDFMREFQAIPARAFDRVANAPSTIAVRCSWRICYVVSLSQNPQVVRLRGFPGQSLRRLTTSDVIPISNGTVTLPLRCFEVIAFEAEDNVAVSQITASVSS